MRNKPNDIPYGGLNPYKIHSAQPTLNPESLEILKYYVGERYKIHMLKDVENKPFPWTDDPILSMYRFTNIRREHDKNSKYIISKMKQHGNTISMNMIGNIMLFRLFNKIDTMSLMGGWVDFEHYDHAKVKRQLTQAPEGYAYFTNAYLSSGVKREFSRYFPDEDVRAANIPHVIDKFLFSIYNQIINATNPNNVIDAFKQVKGIHDFFAYQLFVDLTYLDDFRWSENEFVVSGLGCSMGLSYLFDDPDGLSDEELLFWLRDNCPITDEWCMEHMTDLPEEERHMNVMSLENCVCELAKYIKTKRGTGRPRSLYKI